VTRRAIRAADGGLPRYGCITLTTDYGHGAGFVGALHAVAFRIAPDVAVIDLDHSVPPQDVRLGALRLQRFMSFVPNGVHVGVVDPGVGSTRRAVAITAGRHAFVGPDNGLLLWAAEQASPELRAVVLDRPELWLEPRSRTFDGRDVFVPVAAHLAAGVELGDAGSEVDPYSLVRLARPGARVDAGGLGELEVLQVDGFGNVQLSGDATTVSTLGLQIGDTVTVRTGGTVVRALYAETFAEVPRGGIAVLIDSDGCLALSVNCGRADALLETPLPQTLTIQRG
jgi:S-adenosyl-L-methionine hydrolase (adenosine-forming)